jgi:integrase
MRPEECHRMRWEDLNWAGGRNGTVFIAKGKTKAARRLLPLSIRVRQMLENRWKQVGEPAEGGCGQRTRRTSTSTTTA